MLVVLEILAVTVGVVLLIPAIVFAVENVLALAVGTGLGHRNEPHARARIAVLIPAHNEAAGIAATIQSVLAQVHEHDRILVVADNCTDGTAQAARDAGAEVTERTHETERGKGYALAHGLRALEADRPDLVVFIDADCELTPGCLSALAVKVGRTGGPVQAVYVLDLPDGKPSLRDRVSAFAVRVKNESRPIGLSVLGGPCLITGSGFAVPWDLADADSFARGDIVEDMTIGLDLAVAGNPPYICRGARVHSWLPSADAAKQTQRERWEHGHLETLVKRGLPMLGRGVLTFRRSLMLLGLELMVPPLSLLVMLVGTYAVGLGFAAWMGLSVLPAAVGAVGLGLVLAGTAAAWWTVGREIIPPRALPGVVFGTVWYVASKGSIYLGALVKRQTGWVRTARDAESDSTATTLEESEPTAEPASKA